MKKIALAAALAAAFTAVPAMAQDATWSSTSTWSSTGNGQQTPTNQQTPTWSSVNGTPVNQNGQFWQNGQVYQPVQVADVTYRQKLDTSSQVLNYTGAFVNVVNALGSAGAFNHRAQPQQSQMDSFVQQCFAQGGVVTPQGCVRQQQVAPQQPAATQTVYRCSINGQAYATRQEAEAACR